MKKTIIICILVLLCVFAISSCDQKKDTKNDPTPQSTDTATPGPTPVPTESSTPKPTKEPLPSEELGKPSDKSEVIYENDFFEEDLDDTLLVTYNVYSFKDGKIILNSEDGGKSFKGWNALTPDIDCFPSDAYQWEFHIEFETEFPENDTSSWMATIIGARVSNYVSAIANTDDGIWVAFTENNKVTVFPSASRTKEYWPAGAVAVDIPEGFGEMKKLVVVDTGDSLYYYMNTAEEENVLILRIDIDEDYITVFNASGEEVFKADNFLDMEMGNHFKIFSHFAHTYIDSLAIKAY